MTCSNIATDNHGSVIAKLKFIGNVQEGEKINVKYMYTQPKGLQTTLSRTFYSCENRVNTINFLEATLDRAIELTYILKNSQKLVDKSTCYNLIRDIERSKKGIENIGKTYFDDLIFKSRIDTLIEKVNANMIDIMSDISIEELEKYSPVSPAISGISCSEGPDLPSLT